MVGFESGLPLLNGINVASCRNTHVTAIIRPFLPAQYNGFYTLDTYNNFYPLWYKHKFRKIIAPELAKNSTLKSYFDQWGGRCYIFVDELGKNYLFSKHSNNKIHHLNLNTKALKAMGGDYVLSAVPILNAKENHLKLLKTFNDPNVWWRVYLYQVV